MNIIYTYKTIDISKGGYSAGLGSHVLSIYKQSVESANKFGSTTIYCDEESYNIFKNSDIPFTNIVFLKEIDELDTHHWGLHKLLVMSKQDRPFVHIDLDLILLEKPKLYRNYDICFAENEWNFLHKDISIVDEHEIEFIWSKYVSNYNKYHKDNPLFNQVNFITTPCYSYVEVNNPQIIKKAWQDTLSLSKPCMHINDNSLNQYLEEWVSYSMIRKYTNKIKHHDNIDWLSHNRTEKFGNYNN